MDPASVSGMLWASSTAVAWALDSRWGEPPVGCHPVVWMGRVLAHGGRWARGQATAARAFGAGAIAWVLGAAIAVLTAWGVQWMVIRGVRWCGDSAGLIGTAVGGMLGSVALGAGLKPMLSPRMLFDEVSAVERALGEAGGDRGGGDGCDEAATLAAGRTQLARLVSRDVAQLSAVEVREAAIETLAENLNDALVAPLFWWLIGGLPGAALYRWANTADAMWGYRGVWEWAGKWAARADDVLSWVPARLTAMLLRPTLSWFAWRALAQEATHTPSPNGGWPMGAMALRLGVRLSKPGVYVLNQGGRAPHLGDVGQAVQWARRAAAWMWGVCCAWALFSGGGGVWW